MTYSRNETEQAPPQRRRGISGMLQMVGFHGFGANRHAGREGADLLWQRPLW